VDAEGVEADFEHGVLEIRIPKPESQRPRRISVAVGGQASTPTIEGGEAPQDGDAEAPASA
jgi:HSP20 family protein